MVAHYQFHAWFAANVCAGFRYSCRPCWLQDGALSLEDGEIRAEQPAQKDLTHIWETSDRLGLELSMIAMFSQGAQLSFHQHSL